jgi:hypothetical protein
MTTLLTNMVKAPNMLHALAVRWSAEINPLEPELNSQRSLQNPRFKFQDLISFNSYHPPLPKKSKVKGKSPNRAVP